MKVADVMTNDLVTCRADDSLNRAAQLMWERRCGTVAVVDDAGKAVGVLTDRDVCMAAYTKGRRLDDVAVASAMSRAVRTVRASAVVEDAEDVMAAHAVRRLVVVGDDGRACGMLSIDDIARSGAEWDGKGEIDLEQVALTLGEISRRSAGDDDETPDEQTPETDITDLVHNSLSALRALREEDPRRPQPGGQRSTRSLAAARGAPARGRDARARRASRRRPQPHRSCPQRPAVPQAPARQPPRRAAGPLMVMAMTIVVATDFAPCSQRAVQLATALARRRQASLFLVHVIEHPPVDVPAMGMGPTAWQHNFIAAAEVAIAREASEIRQGGIPVDTHVALGSPAAPFSRPPPSAAPSSSWWGRTAARAARTCSWVASPRPWCAHPPVPCWWPGMRRRKSSAGRDRCRCG